MSEIILDPVTEKEFDDAVGEAFNELVEALDDDVLGQMDYQDIAEMFFYNGFLRGCIATLSNEEIKETLYMMTKEIEYQNKKQ